ncbi:bifunctional DNA-formamidopyrimidine glycosylase/DNA-(apurinic or apyrimidinic site) lyase [Candidatus Bipolaricaulota bacterium]|nr:bifunctional DNA-formamidopyrimidine glycosylase/DNA-(apurinic or apyrimidinic site) lyase [Candidatus Bipolaricaulota bacterium]
MPELPEVETVVRGLRSRILEYTIEKAEVTDKELLGNLEAKALKEKLENRKITDIRRRGKYILIELDDNRLLTIHLRMTGKLLVRALGEETEHQRLSLVFREGVQLIMDNLRRFGTLDLLDSEEEEPLTSLGLEPFRDGYEWEEFRELFETTQAVKLILLDQKKIAGLGNIYANELLFRANLNPLTPGNKIGDEERKRLFKLIPEVLSEAIESNGTTFDTFRDSYGDPGSFQNFLRVYQKEGEPCPNCGSKIVKVKQSGRSTYYCQNCQNRKKQSSNTKTN